jgi:hypothetical protein
MKAGGFALKNLIQPTISLEMAVPSQGIYPAIGLFFCHNKWV